MNESTSDNSALNLLDSSNSRTSGEKKVSTLDRPNKELIENLSKRLRELESENLELKRAIPRLKKAKKDDCTEWAIQIISELEREHAEHIKTQQNFTLLANQFHEFERDTVENTQRDAKTIEELRRQAKEYEEENRRLRDRWNDDQLMVFQRKRGCEHLEEEKDGGQPSSEENSEEAVRVCFEHIDRRSDTEEQESGHSSTQRRLRHQLQQSFDIISILFEKHRSLANSIGRLLLSHGDTKDASLLRKINDMKLDLNQSMEMCKRRFDELRSAPTSAESSLHEPLSPETKAKALENERDALKVQLNNEIATKQRFSEKSEASERNLREARRNIEELRGELRSSLAKAEQMEETERRMKECQEDARSKEEHIRTKSKELGEATEQIRTLRHQNLDLDCKNEQILQAVHRLKQIHADEMNLKDIEMQRQSESVQNMEQRCRALEQQLIEEQKRRNCLEEEAQRKDELIKKYLSKTKAFRHLLTQYGHYLGSSVEYEKVVEKSSRILQDKIIDGQRSCSSTSNQQQHPLILQQHQPSFAAHDPNNGGSSSK